jgi:hypothetical protein
MVFHISGRCQTVGEVDRGFLIFGRLDALAAPRGFQANYAEKMKMKQKWRRKGEIFGPTQPEEGSKSAQADAASGWHRNRTQIG